MKKKTNGSNGISERYSIDEVKEKIKLIISQIMQVGTKDLNDDALILEKLDIDSLRAIEIIAAIEKEFKVKLNEKLFTNAKTLSEFIDIFYKF